MKNGLSRSWFVLPRLIPALILAGLIQVLTPGGPMVSVPLLVALANSGAAMPALFHPD